MILIQCIFENLMVHFSVIDKSSNFEILKNLNLNSALMSAYSKASRPQCRLKLIVKYANNITLII